MPFKAIFGLYQGVLMLTLYGISNCDTIRKTRRFLDDRAIPYQFIDVRKTPLSLEKLTRISAQVGLDVLVNRRGQTYRKLKIKERNPNETELLRLLHREQAMIRRPLLEYDNRYHVGYDEEALSHFLQNR
ncbi:MAG: Spx/MgsR family RNA polymerase-binding regulatory protein [Calditrichaeota bacterium]|nr:MAG: Spx/MgsR family RNA polymerase-binding regulatory protein [Calditrichota bacterium]